MDIPSTILNLGNKNNTLNNEQVQNQDIENITEIFKSCVNIRKSYDEKFSFPNISKKIEKTSLPVVNLQKRPNITIVLSQNDEEKKRIISQIDIILLKINSLIKNTNFKLETINENIETDL